MTSSADLLKAIFFLMGCKDQPKKYILKLMAARVLVTCLLFISSWFIGETVHAQTSPATSSADLIQTVPITLDLPVQSPQYANIVVINLIHSFSCLAEGVSVIGQPCIVYQRETQGPNAGAMVPKETLLSSQGALSSISGLIISMYATPPLSTQEYLADAFNGTLTTPAYAQVSGSGNNVLSPILPLWKIARNISYIAMIFIFLVIGFMIMFRHKINPQTVISAQSALPGLVIGLILITFSYFLAALVVDVTFVSVRVAGKVFEAENIMQSGTTDNLLNNGNLFGIFNSFFSLKYPEQIIDSTTGTLTSLQKDTAFADIINKVSWLGGCLIAKQLTPDIKVGLDFIVKIDIPVGKLLGCVGGGSLVSYLASTSAGQEFMGGLAGFILYVVLMIALLIAMFKTLFALITSYISILINTITAPLQFLIGSIPGKQNALSGWLKSMLGNLLVFPAIFAAFLFAAFILGNKGAPAEFGIIGDQTGNFKGTVPFLGGLNPEFLKMAFAYGILLIMPTIPEAIKGAFGVKDNQLFGKGALGGFMAGFGAVRTGAGKLVEGWSKDRAAAGKAYETARYELDPRKRAQIIEQIPEVFPWWKTVGVNDYGMRRSPLANSSFARTTLRTEEDLKRRQTAWTVRFRTWLLAHPGRTRDDYVAANPGDLYPES